MSKKKAPPPSLFQCPEAAVMWKMADDASLGVSTLGELYPMTLMPDDIARIKVEHLSLYIFKDKDREKALEWLNQNVDYLD